MFECTDIWFKAKLERKYPSMKKDDPQYLATAARIKDKCTDVRYTIKKEVSPKIKIK
jgi:hypothetical protein